MRPCLFAGAANKLVQTSWLGVEVYCLPLLRLEVWNQNADGAKIPLGLLEGRSSFLLRLAAGSPHVSGLWPHHSVPRAVLHLPLHDLPVEQPVSALPSLSGFQSS